MTAIFITQPGSYLKAKYHYFQVFQQNKLCLQIHSSQVSQITLFDNCRLQSQAASLAESLAIPVLFLDNQGNYLGRLQLESQHSAKYFQQQIKRTQNLNFTKTIAESIVRAYLHNCCVVLFHLTANHSTPKVEIAMEMLDLLIDDLPMADSIHALREYSTTGASLYYQSITELLAKAFNFQCTCRPHFDSIKSVLRLGNALLNQTIYGFVQSAGLNPNFGSLHLYCQDELSLIEDFALEFRPFLVDELVATLAISQILTPDDFTQPTKQGVISLHPAALKKFINHWQAKLQTEVTHLYAEKLSYRCCLEWQVREYIAYLLGDTEFYRPMLLKWNADTAISPISKQPKEQRVLVKL
ncbi:CRISPR-associated endonuclease Cas1 [[Phormidium ambiguum] IAM M-71]|uniref:CRISPR-associated endonuclease Cas1 n=1 Tax=[Phormidium ambiguum] IAM M-71 TaxID=454136 RepID=A0A1U7I564_9CYAN|nr:CRISPR-associated endonuclease Cas1 [Phormidium ambiguum]OKH31345.1 CRISPR-associated endonuclease Cas1 [Phormidium ambiguum IAM M-71]